MDVKITDNSGEVLDAFRNAVERGLFAVGATAEKYAKQIITEAPRVDTGRLRNSITHAEEENATIIGTNVEYAIWNELGTGKHVSGGRPDEWIYVDEFGVGHKTSGVSPLHFLKRAASEHTDEYKKLMEDSLKNE